MTKNTKSAQALDLAALASTARVGGELPKATRTRNAEESALTPLVLDAIADGQVRSLDNIPHDVDDKDSAARNVERLLRKLVTQQDASLGARVRITVTEPGVATVSFYVDQKRSYSKA